MANSDSPSTDKAANLRSELFFAKLHCQRYGENKKPTDGK